MDPEFYRLGRAGSTEEARSKTQDCRQPALIMAQPRHGQDRAPSQALQSPTASVFACASTCS